MLSKIFDVLLSAVLIIASIPLVVEAIKYVRKGASWMAEKIRGVITGKTLRKTKDLPERANDFGFIGLKDPISKTIDYLESVQKDTKSSSLLVLNGPYGSGKNSTLEAIANAYGYSILKFEVSSSLDRYMNSKAIRIKEFFDMALQSSNVICVFDDISNIFVKSASVTSDVSNNEHSGKLEAFFAGLKAIKGRGIPVIGITRNIENLEPRIKDCCDVANFRLLTTSERNALIANKLESLVCPDKNNIINKIARNTDGWSVAYLQVYLEQIMTNIKNKAYVFSGETLTIEDKQVFIEPFEEIQKRIQNRHDLICKPILPKLRLDQESISYAGMSAISDDVKNEFDSLLDFIWYPHVYKDILGCGINNLLLVGPGGTGKTLFAKSIANQANIAFVYINTSYLAKSSSDAATEMRKIFDYAKALECIMFFDEMDAMYSPSYPESVRNMIKTEIDGFEKENEKTFIVIGATNHPERIDPASRTRFRELKFLLPNKLQRSILFEELISSYVKKNIEVVHDGFNDLNAAYQYLADITDNKSYREIKVIVDSGIKAAIKASSDKKNIKLNITEHIVKKISMPGLPITNSYDYHRNSNTAFQPFLFSSAAAHNLSASNGLIAHEDEGGLQLAHAASGLNQAIA